MSPLWAGSTAHEYRPTRAAAKRPRNSSVWPLSAAGRQPKLSSTARSIFARMNSECRALIDTFGKGWERGDVDAICSVFTEDAVFLETPFSTPDRGMAAIRAYWKDIPRYQAETYFSSGEIYAAGPWFATEFRCTFRRRRTGEQVDAKGAIFCETKDGKISEMRMYWHRYAGGREEPKA